MVHTTNLEFLVVLFCVVRFLCLDLLECGLWLFVDGSVECVFGFLFSGAVGMPTRQYSKTGDAFFFFHF